MSQVHVSLLQKAKQRIECLSTAYVCFAIEDSANKTNLQSAYELTTWISRAIGGENMSVSSWLNKQGFPWHQLTPENMREYRLRWIDSMIPIVKEWK